MLLHDAITHYARYYGSKTAIVDRGKEWSYRDLEDTINQCANLINSLDIGPGDRVACITKNSPWYLALLFATAKAGAVYMPINYRLNGEEMSELLTDAGVKIVFAQSQYLGKLRSSNNPGVSAEYISLNPDHECPYPVLEEVIPGFPVGYAGSTIAPEDNVLLQYTSGTTGKPKGVLSSHSSWVDSCLLQGPVKRVTENSVLLCVLPMCYTGGTKSTLEALFAGATLVITDDFDPDECLSLIENHGVTNSYLVPTMLYRLIDAFKDKPRKLDTLNYINIGGATINEKRLLEAVRVFNCQFTKGYGMTEIAGGSITAAKPEDHVRDGEICEKIHSVGLPLIDCQVRIIDEHGNEVTPGESGELIVKTQRVMSGYINSPPGDSVTDPEGFYHTGDMAMQDADGYFYIVDRKKDMVVSGGLNIYSREVEAVLEANTSVQSAFVVGMPDDYWGEIVHAFVVLKDGEACTPDTLITWCKANLSSYKAPKEVTFVVEDKLPLSISGKVVKKKLREAYLSAKREEHIDSECN